MKKLLLCTSALVALASWSASAQEGMSVNFKGLSTFEAGFVSNDKNHKDYFTYSPNQKTSAFYTQQRAVLNAEGKADALTYGAMLNLQMVGNSDTSSGDFSSARSYIYVDTDAGSVHLGSNVSASKMMKIDAGTIASATGGVDGDWTNFGKQNFFSAEEKDKNSVTNLVARGVDTLANRVEGMMPEGARKIAYLSPRISGIQLGLSFTPDLSNSGTGRATDAKNGAIFYLDKEVQLKNVWSLGLNAKHTMNDVDLGFSAVADMGKNNARYNNTVRNFRDLKTYAVGLSVATKGFTLAASYQDDGKSLTDKENSAYDKFKANWWTVGLAYGQDKWSTSVTYLSGKKGVSSDYQMKNSQVSLGADYEVVPGMKAFAEVTNINAKPKAATNTLQLDTNKQKTTVFMLGTYLKF
jgi:outer membrane protein OmpU